MTLTELYRKIIDELSPSLGANEAKATARLLLEDDLWGDAGGSGS